MPTEVLRVEDRAALQAEFAHAGRVLRAGGLVAFPTETVYGIAVSAEAAASVERLYRLKGRPREKPMTTMVADQQVVLDLCPSLSDPGGAGATARSLMRRFWPGPLTLVLRDREGRMTGFRLPASPLARGLVREAGVALLVPSANPAGSPPAVTAEEVLRYFPQELDLVIDGGPAEGGVASTVVQVEGDRLDVLREGAIPAARLDEARERTILFVCHGNTDRSPLAAALLRRRLATQLGVEESALPALGRHIESAGIAAVPGRRASLYARRVAQEWQLGQNRQEGRQGESPPGGPLDLARHRARKLTAAMVEEAERVFCMERDQREQILAFFPHRERDVLLVDPEGGDIEDPAGGSLDTYRRLARRLDAAAALIVWGLARTGR